jgi:hypothetical protein
MPRLSRAIADYIITEALAAQTTLSPSQIQGTVCMDALGLDSAAKHQVRDHIVRAIESIGFRIKFSIDAFSDAQTVDDLIDILVAATDGGPISGLRQGS